MEEEEEEEEGGGGGSNKMEGGKERNELIEIYKKNMENLIIQECVSFVMENMIRKEIYA